MCGFMNNVRMSKKYYAENITTRHRHRDGLKYWGYIKFRNRCLGMLERFNNTFSGHQIKACGEEGSLDNGCMGSICSA